MSNKVTGKDVLKIFNPVNWFKWIFGIPDDETTTPSIETTWTTLSSLSSSSLSSSTTSTTTTTTTKITTIKNKIATTLTSNIHENNSQISLIQIFICLFIISFIIIMF